MISSGSRLDGELGEELQGEENHKDDCNGDGHQQSSFNEVVVVAKKTSASLSLQVSEGLLLLVET